ncbi:carbamoyltransferase C-terminal domain-containing protein, partial [Candidatus Omnitrophota bacterium]
GTGRVQSVTRDINQRYYDLIKEFDTITGVPMVLNTSFNIRGEPIVNTPHEAITCFLKTGMDALFLGDYFFYKTEEYVNVNPEVIRREVRLRDEKKS